MRALVTGGGGFLGKAIATRLRSSGYDVRSLARGDYPELATLGIECVRGDVADSAAVLTAARDCDLVFHVAAKAGVWGGYESYHLANVVGTENVLAACREQQIPKLIYTSSPSVVFNGKDEAGIDESAPYPHDYLTHYPKTKAIAERAVLTANGERLANGRVLSTVALRPHLNVPGRESFVALAAGRIWSIRCTSITLRKLISWPHRSWSPGRRWLAKRISSRTGNRCPCGI
jgi:nucleoside-diphosphate-sugar epimerase